MLQFEVVPFAATARQHRLAVENTTVGCVSRNNGPSVAPPLVSNSIPGAYSPLPKTRGHRPRYWSRVKRKPSVFTRRHSPPFIRLRRNQGPIRRYDGWIIVATCWATAGRPININSTTTENLNMLRQRFKLVFDPNPVPRLRRRK